MTLKFCEMIVPTDGDFVVATTSDCKKHRLAMSGKEYL
jgi:hypothetical protein